MRPGTEPVLGDDEALPRRLRAAPRRAGGRPRRSLRSAPRRRRTPPTDAPSWARRGAMSTPGVSTGTMNIEARCEGRASGSVTAITIRKSAIEPLEVNHLRPSITQPSPSARARVRSWVGSEPGVSRLGHAEGAAQVAGEQRVQPALLLLARSRRAPGSRSCPSPGAALPNASGAIGEVPRISCMRPRRTWPRPWPPSSGRQVGGPQAALLDFLLQRLQRARAARRSRAPARSPRAARSPGGRTSSSSPAAPGTRGLCEKSQLMAILSRASLVLRSLVL